MLFLIDENLPRSVGDVFLKRGFEVMVVRDNEDLRGASDEDLFDYAIAHSAVIVTRDLGFANPLRFELKKLAGMVVLRFPNEISVSVMCSSLERSIARLDDGDYHRLIIIEPGMVRMRNL